MYAVNFNDGSLVAITNRARAKSTKGSLLLCGSKILRVVYIHSFCTGYNAFSGSRPVDGLLSNLVLGGNSFVEE
jgi:hypothetical protein